ncbi:hypothetical protein [Oceanicoccus sp. KOV_DT_Chl]|uniref:hypothetical protein n=1 Tax=Oceanicoccus sp. KOV_DT_Chl TaxID=1904639 RepID=UPI0011AEC728|nr:hypothetical protein [Oceanicoccus sp. KOV_DT_Chl]
MSQKDNDSMHQGPKITPAHDEIASFARTKAKGSLVASLGEVPDVEGGAASAGVKTMLALVVLALLATAAWAGYLHQQLQAADRSLQDYELRITDLERQLSVTDESMSESSVAMKVKIRELDSEIRKLWDNVWKKSKEQFAQQGQLLKQQQESITANQLFIKSTKDQFSKNETVVASLSKQLKAAEQLQVRVAANQKALSDINGTVESTADKANRLNNEILKLERRVKETEGWLESINGFRRQVNSDITVLKQSVGQLQGSPVN